MIRLERQVAILIADYGYDTHQLNLTDDEVRSDVPKELRLIGEGRDRHSLKREGGGDQAREQCGTGHWIFLSWLGAQDCAAGVQGMGS